MATAIAPTPVIIAADAGAGATPDTVHPAVPRMAPRWMRCRDVFDGTDVIQAKGEAYLPKHPAETQEDYDRRRIRAALFNAYGRTVSAMIGLVFQRDPQLTKEVPAALRQHWENLDLAGTHGAVLAARAFTDAMIDGHGGFLVDYPPVPNAERLTKAQEQQLGARPYWAWYPARDIISWRYAKVGHATVLVQLVLREWVERRVGAFGSELVPRYRVYRRPEVEAPVVPIAYEVWEPKHVPVTAEDRRAGLTGETRLVFERVDDGEIRNQAAIPFSPLVVGHVLAPLETKPPLLDLADLNLDHYRVRNDRRHLMHLGCVPVPVRKGYRPPVDQQAGGKAEQAIGPNVLMDVPADGDFSWAEITGAAFEPSEKELEQIERQMAASGLAFIAGDTRAPETAKAKTLDATAQNATLAKSVRGLRDALELGLGFHAAYLRIQVPKRAEDGSGGAVDVNTEFEETVLPAEDVRAMSEMEARGQLSLETFWLILEQGKRLPSGFDREAERARITAGGGRDDGGNGDDGEDDDEELPSGGAVREEGEA